MSAVVWHVTMSLDGFITGPDDAMEWAFAVSGPSRPSFRRRPLNAIVQ